MAEQAGAGSELRVKLVWITVFRTVATTLLLAATALRLLSSPLPELSREDSLSFALIGFVYVLTLLYGLLLRRRSAEVAAAYIQVLGDIVVASSLVFLTGGIESPFTFTYSLAVVAASILLYQRGALLSAACSAVAFSTLALLIQSGAIRAPLGSGILPAGRVAFLLISNTLAQFLLAVLASYLARQLSTAGGRLYAREQDLRKLATTQRQILACMPSGLITCDPEGQVTFVNLAGINILGLPSEDAALGLPIAQLVPGLTTTSFQRRAELRVSTPLGDRMLGLSVSLMEGSGGAALIVFQDLTDLRKVENALKRSDQLAALGRLSAQLAHEIRNPLAAMRGSAQMLADEATLDGPPARMLQIIIREADRLSSLVDEFLRFARPPPPTLRECELGTVVEQTLEMMQADPATQQVRLESAVERVRARVDPDQMRQVLINLLRNALFAAGQGGRVVVRVADRDGRPSLSVWDSGGSIPEANLSRLFTPFFTTRQGGTGLGLATSQSIVRAHGGIIEVSSTRASGTEFVVTLPPVDEVQVADPGGR